MITEPVTSYNTGSLNCITYNYASLSKLINGIITDSKSSSSNKDDEIKMPPTRESIIMLCTKLNLKIKPTKVIDCVLYCRGPKQERAPSEDFDMNLLVKWFLINIKTLHHDNLKKVDPDWLYKK
jgi:hypothetical protein